MNSLIQLQFMFRANLNPYKDILYEIKQLQMQACGSIILCMYVSVGSNLDVKHTECYL